MYTIAIICVGMIKFHILQQAIMKVLRQEGKNKLKFNKARTFVYNKRTDHRCEERRGVSMLVKKKKMYKICHQGLIQRGAPWDPPSPENCQALY